MTLNLRKLLMTDRFRWRSAIAAKSPRKPILFFDFDNTLTEGDILDEVIETYSESESWRDWEHAWRMGKLPACECLRLQIEGLRVSPEQLFKRLSQVRIDPAFADIVAWAWPRGIEVNIVSDNFRPLIQHILSNNGVGPVPVFANELQFAAGDRLIPSFPYHDAASSWSANAKARHLSAYRTYHQVILAGDGLSDIDAALAAAVVVAKHTLARELESRGVSFYPFDTLEPVLAFLETTETADSRWSAVRRVARS